MSTFYEYVRSLELPKLIYDEGEINIEGSRRKLLKTTNGKHEIQLLYYDEESNSYKKKNSTVQKITIDPDLDVDDIVDHRSIRIENYADLSTILQLPENGIKRIDISAHFEGIRFDRSVLKINSDSLKEIISETKSINKKSSAYFNSSKRYYSNRATEKYLGIEIRTQTNVKKGEFELLVKKLNLQNKSEAKDLKNYLNKNDLAHLEKLCDFLVKKEVFSGAFLNRLDDFFIREKLQHILAIGQEILALGTTNLSTDKAKRVISNISDEGISQLETVWQKYFEKYLLHLIFSYQSIHGKVQFTDVEGEKKYPDFIGVNHYGGVDIIEIKTHLKNALIFDKSHKNYAFSGELSKAIIQTMNYIDLLIKHKINRRTTEQAVLNYLLEQNIYRPRGIIIISSKERLVSGFNQKGEQEKESIIRDFTKLRNSLNNIEILTFNEVLETARNYTENIVPNDC